MKVGKGLLDAGVGGLRQARITRQPFRAQTRIENKPEYAVLENLDGKY
jgi:hypothetical protein